MVTTPELYASNRNFFNSLNRPVIAYLPDSKIHCYVDLETRTVDAPDFLSVNTDHVAETVYFTVNRYYEHTDLAETFCIISYINANGKSHVYNVPFYDIWSAPEPDTMIFPWCIDGHATEKAGEVKFVISFLKVDETGKVVYRLNTREAKSEILYGMPDNFNPEDYELDQYSYETIMGRLDAIEKEYDIYWEIAPPLK